MPISQGAHQGGNEEDFLQALFFFCKPPCLTSCFGNSSVLVALNIVPFFSLLCFPLSEHYPFLGCTVFIGYCVLTSLLFSLFSFRELQLSYPQTPSVSAVAGLPRSLCTVLFMVASQGLWVLPFPFLPSWNFQLSVSNTYCPCMVSIFYKSFHSFMHSFILPSFLFVFFFLTPGLTIPTFPTCLWFGFLL